MSSHGKCHREPLFGLIALLLVAMAACSDEDFYLNDSVIKSNSYAEMTTTAEMSLSTFRLDSVQTSGQNRIWVGKVEKPLLGTIHSESFFRVAQPVLQNNNLGYNWLGNNKEVYDSCTITLRHTGQYEGDTTYLFSIQVQLLDTRLEFAEGGESSFYNVRDFPATDSVIGQFVFNPRPNSRPNLRFRLNDSFGRSFRDFIRAQVNLSATDIQQNFERFIKGVKITSSDTVTWTQGQGKMSRPRPIRSLMAFYADSTIITLHSHTRGMESIKVERRLRMTNGELQFNRVWNDGMDPALATIEHRYDQVTESQMNDRALIYEGLGYYTRINFPSIESLKNLSRYQHIVKAVLKIYPDMTSYPSLWYEKRSIPTSFSLGEVNRGNVMNLANIRTASGGSVTAYLVNEDVFDRSRSYYYADITYYVNTILAQDRVDEYNGLVVMWGAGMSPVNYNFMVFNGHGVDLRRSALEVTFYNFDREER